MGEAGYHGGAFHPQLVKGKTGGKVLVDGTSILFQSEEIAFQLPLEGIEIKSGGAGEKLIFFSHPDRAEQVIYSRDRKILNDSLFRLKQSVHRQRKSIKLRLLKRRAWFFATFILILITLSSAYLLKDPAIGIVAQRLPSSFEDSLGETFIKQYATDHKFIDSQIVEEQLDDLVSPLITAIGSDRYDFEFYIVQDPSLNAFALPGGHIVINSGLILGASSAEEVLGVIAHEIAHVTEQHGVRKVLESAGLYIVLSGLFGDVSGITAVLLSNGSFLLQQQFSREFEREADRLAIVYLTRAGVNPSGLCDFFKKLEEKENDLEGLAVPLSLLSTHPATNKRIAAIKKAIDEIGESSYQETSFDLKAFQSTLYETTDDLNQNENNY